MLNTKIQYANTQTKKLFGDGDILDCLEKVEFQDKTSNHSKKLIDDIQDFYFDELRTNNTQQFGQVTYANSENQKLMLSIKGISL